MLIPIPPARRGPSFGHPARAVAGGGVATGSRVLEPALLELVSLVPGGHVLIRGRLDVRTVADVRLLLHESIDGGEGELLVDLAEAEVGDATGLGVLVGAHHRARRAGRQLVLVDVSARMERLLRAARLQRVLDCRPSASSLRPTGRR